MPQTWPDEEVGGAVAAMMDFIRLTLIEWDTFVDVNRDRQPCDEPSTVSTRGGRYK